MTAARITLESAQRLGRMADRLDSLGHAGSPAHGSVHTRGVMFGRLCRVVSEGPTGEANLTDHHYWLAPSKFDYTGGSLQAVSNGDPAIKAVNLSELSVDGPGAHLVAVNAVVRATFAATGAEGEPLFAFSYPVPAVMIEIASATGSGYPRTYQAKAVAPDGQPFGQERAAFNLAEDDYTNQELIQSYRAFMVGDRVMATWGYADQRFEFREFRLYSTEPCP